MSIVRYIWKLGEIEKLDIAPVMLICNDGDRGFIFSGKRYAQLLDSINDRLTNIGIGTLSLSLPFSKLPPDSAYGRVFAVNGMLARAGIRDKLTALFSRTAQFHCDARVGAWAAILNRVQPKVIIAIQPPSELCIAAKKAGVWIADLQHGIISDEGYYGLAFRAKYKQEGWPSCILCWDTIAENWIRNYIGSLVSTKVIGHPWIIRFVKPNASDRLVAECINKGVPNRSARLTILVTLLWGVSHSAECDETGIHIGLREFIRDHGQAYDWWLRVHPMMVQGTKRAQTFARLAKEFSGQKNISWEHCSDLPLPLLLRQVNLHMTISSAVTIEAGWFGIKTALLGKNEDMLNQWLGEEIRSGTAEIVPAESEQIEQWIERNAKPARNLLASDRLNGQLLDGFIEDVVDYLSEENVSSKPH